MLEKIDPSACSHDTRAFLVLALQAAEVMDGNWADVFPRGAAELKEHVVRATRKFLQPEPAALENLFEQRALLYYLTLAKALVCQAAISAGGPLPARWKLALRELDGLKALCALQEVANEPPPKPSMRIPLSFFSGPDARIRRDFTEHVIEATTQEVRSMQRQISPNPFRLLTSPN